MEQDLLYAVYTRPPDDRHTTWTVKRKGLETKQEAIDFCPDPTKASPHDDLYKVCPYPADEEPDPRMTAGRIQRQKRKFR